MLDCTFPCNQFYVAGFKQFRRDRNRFGSGLMLPKFPDLDWIVFELHQNKCKWLFLGIYKSPCQNGIEFPNRINSILDHYLTTYENIILIGDFNLCVENTHLEATLENYDLSNLINKPTCYRLNNPTCIDLILTNKNNLFKLSDTFETGLSDHHKLYLNYSEIRRIRRKT